VSRHIPGIQPEVDAKARVIGYGFGRSYADTICTVILSKGGIKIGFYRGSELPDPEGMLAGAGKLHRHVVINDEGDLRYPAFVTLLAEAAQRYRVRSKK
jgi:hypothetical protein